MKKFALILLFVFTSILTTFAVPRGIYKDSRGNEVLVTDNGEEIYFFDSAGNVTKRLIVIKENPDGSFVVKDASNGLTFPQNAYWFENGVCYLNLQLKSRTFQREE